MFLIGSCNNCEYITSFIKWDIDKDIMIITHRISTPNSVLDITCY
jgi:hypothetical protein